jgi:tellurite methyltransferase
MPTSQAEWDAKYRLDPEEPTAEPAGILREVLAMLPASGPVLDLACGRGRNAIYLAQCGRHVIAVDWSAVALDSLENAARRKGIPVRRIRRLADSSGSPHAGLELAQCDLEKIEIPASSYGAILCIRYLHRQLFPQISRALRPGGLLVYETFTQAQLEYEGGPRDLAHLLQPGELRKAFPELEVLFYRELRAGQGIASLVAQKRSTRTSTQNGN